MSSTGVLVSLPRGLFFLVRFSVSDAVWLQSGCVLQVSSDDNTLQVTLTARTLYFLELTKTPAHVPVQQATVEANGEARAVDARHLHRQRPLTRLLSGCPAPHHDGRERELLNVDSLAGLTPQLTPMEDDAAQLTAFQSGELDYRRCPQR